MSAELATLLPLGAPAPRREEAPRPRIAPVPRPAVRRKPKVLYAAVVVGSMVLISLAQLMLSIALGQGAYEINGLQREATDLTRTSALLQEEINLNSSPQNLAANATSMGMVSVSTPAYLRLSDGAVLGSPTVASTSGSSISGSPMLVPNSLLGGIVVGQAALVQQQQEDAAAAELTVQQEATALLPGDVSLDATTGAGDGAGAVTEQTDNTLAPGTLPGPSTH